MPKNLCPNDNRNSDYLAILSDYFLRSPWHFECLQVLNSAEKWLNKTQSLNHRKSGVKTDLWLAAGFVRNLVWDHLHGCSPERTEDVDVIYHSQGDNGLQQRERTLEKHLFHLAPEIPWQVRDQARMHLRNEDLPYQDIAHAMEHWPEKETAVAVRINDLPAKTEPGTLEQIKVCAPFGLELLWKAKISWNPRRSREVFTQRLEEKKWLERWPILRPE